MTFNPKQVRVPPGQPGGGRWGAPRDTKAASAQKNTKAGAAADNFRGLPAGKRTAYLKGLSDSDLEALTGVVYSSRTSDPDVVAMRITVANELAKRGLDVKKYGALGGGPTAGKPTPQKVAPKKAAVQWGAARKKAAPVSKPAAAPKVTASRSSGKTAI